MLAIEKKSLIGTRAWMLALGVLSGMALLPRPSSAQEMLQLVVPSKEYTLGHFKYQPPQADGWRQMSVSPDTLSLVYAEKKSAEDDAAINTLFGAAFEAHDIPDGVKIESAQSLGELSRKQISDQRKDDVVSADPVQAVSSVPDMYTYRLLVHSPIKGDPDGYEVYFVLTSPDRKQYLVIQGITKSQKYQDELYYNQFYGSLTSLKYDRSIGADVPAPAPASPPAVAPSAAPASPPPAAATPPAPATAPAPATPPAAH
ncbi:MAG TPA: hypothetical protein VN634_13760 [Candidatus Limnocylindrales bacterium]|nr:hypothetical protein [Candidatus Limnocylindrales bacterium]